MTNTKFKELSEEMSKLEKQIKTVIEAEQSGQMRFA